MGDMIEAMKRRVSVRSYADRPVEQSVKEKIRGLLDAHNTGPFGNAVRLSLIDLSDMEQAETRHLGTYGFISGARLYVAGVVGRRPGCDAGLRLLSRAGDNQDHTPWPWHVLAWGYIQTSEFRREVELIE